MRRDVAERLGHFSASHLADNDSSRDHCQVGRQRTFATESTESSVIISEKSDENLGTKVVDVVRRKPDTTGVSGVINDVDEEPDESIDKVLPRPRLFGQATYKKTAIDFSQSHGNP